VIFRNSRVKALQAIDTLRRARARRKSEAARLYFANSVEDIQSEVLRCAEEGERLRPIGGHGTESPLSESDETLLSIEHLRGAELAQIERRCLWVRPGTPLRDLIAWLARHGLIIDVTPDYPGQTLGAAVSTGSPAGLSPYLNGLRMVHADGHRTSYSVERDHGLFDAVRISLGALGVITQIELRCTELPAGALRRRQVKFGEALSLLETANPSPGFRTITWFANAPAVVEWWDADATTSEPRQLFEQACGAYLDLVGTPILAGLAATSSMAMRWSDTIGATYANSAGGGILPISAAHAPHRVAYSIPATIAPEFLIRLRDLWRSLRFQVYAPIRIEFAREDHGWLSPSYGRPSAVVSFPITLATPGDFVDSVCTLLESCAGRPTWTGLRPGAPPPSTVDYPRLADFAALRTKIDRRGVFLNTYLASLFGVTAR
jgi:hypothetical protein